VANLDSQTDHGRNHYHPYVFDFFTLNYNSLIYLLLVCLFNKFWSVTTLLGIFIFSSINPLQTINYTLLITLDFITPRPRQSQ